MPGGTIYNICPNNVIVPGPPVYPASLPITCVFKLDQDCFDNNIELVWDMEVNPLAAATTISDTKQGKIM